MFYINVDLATKKITSVSSELIVHQLKEGEVARSRWIPINDDLMDFCRQHPGLTSGAYYVDEKNNILFNEEEYSVILQTEETDELRSLRETNCFSIINRGQAWYNTLTPEQLQELEEWYHAWLNVTDTREVPAKPEWLR